jgi:restriction endonuclease S subunit
MSDTADGKSLAPCDWMTKTLKRFGSLVGGSGFPVDEQGFSQGEMEIPFFKVKDLQSPLTLTETDNYVSKETAARLGATVFPQSTIVFAKVGAALLLNRFRILGREGCIDNNMMAFQLRGKHDVAFFRYVLDGVDLSANFNQGPVPSVNTRQIASIAITAPQFPEQKRIAAYLDASCAAIDVAVAAKRRQLETLDALLKTTIAQAVTQGLDPARARRASGVGWFGEIPEHWGCEHLKRFAARIQTGTTPPTDTPDYYFDGTIPWFAPGSYDDDIELREPRKLINKLALREGALRMFPGGTVFLIGIGATIGKVGLIVEPASCNQQIIGIVSNHRMVGRYLAYQLKIYEDVIPGIAVSTTLPIFDQVKTGYLPVLQPPREEQQAISDFLDAKIAETKRTSAVIRQQIETLVAYRKSLIHEYVTGQRWVTEADIKRVQAHG